MLRILFGLALLCATPAVAQSTLIGSYVWEVDNPLFGGYSGIEVADDGKSFVAVSDR